MKIVFAGSPEFAVPTLERLAAQGYDLGAVITQPDRPVGRDQRLQAPPVKEAALRLGLPVYQPEKIKSDEARACLEGIQPEAVVVVGYGQILRPWLLDLPRYGCINLHASLLPAYRGAAPIQWAIANGETKTGLTTMLMDPGLDTGPILLQWATEIGPEETAIQLAERLSAAGANLMMETLQGLEAGKLVPQPQDHSRASRAPLLKKEDGRIDWSLPAQEIFNRIRGFLPWPGAYTGFREKKLQIWWAKPETERSQNQSRDRERAVTESDNAPSSGELLVGKDDLRVICGSGTVLQILEVQQEGRRRMTAAEFIHGARPETEERLDWEPPV
ncbi:MAG: methionyl-tRNA formyltransferase [Acidobacteria bacterium RIFCSPLOWO2_12_FULL_60_22]|nr:MAG: methionyl-tRNA formyltransferase [Acidobacteria bacterium RIFCSPLOWO2_12_FULL_60_22]